MRINSSKNISSTGTTKKSRKSEGGKGFNPIENEEVSHAPAVSHSMGISDIDAILALQSVDNVNGDERKKQAVHHADLMLNELEALKVSLLSGQATQAQLIKLKNLLDSKPDYTEDSGLVDILNQINLRVSVELAKFSRKK